MAIITLTTDFGTADGFVGAMKGAILSIAPQTTIADITHEIPPHDIRAGTFAVETALPHFPPNTIHVVVVDPGVGSDRAAILVETEHGRYLAPDNGVLTSVVPEESAAKLFTLDKPAYWRSQVSATFHGRDIFAPAAAHLANGVSPHLLGTPTTKMARLPWPQPRRCGDDLVGEVIHVDHFGNLITNVRLADLGAQPHATHFRLRGLLIAGLTPHYAAGDGIMAVVNSGGRIEIALPGAPAAHTLNIGIGEEIRIAPTGN